MADGGGGVVLLELKLVWRLRSEVYPEIGAIR